MRQFELVSKETFEKHEVPVPVPGPGQIRIACKAVGICGSDIHAYYGEHPFMSFPIVLGHECCGEVEAFGQGADKFKKGDRVVLRPQKVCGKCRPCREGRYNVCETLAVLGCQEAGGCSDYYVADENLFYKIPDSLTFGEGTMIEPLAVTVHAALRVGSVEGKKCLVLGGGTIGNLVAQSCKGLGAAAVMLTDIADPKLELAKECGIDHTVNTAKEDLAEAIDKYFGDDGVDIVYECTAAPKALNQVLETVGKGTPVIIVGVYAGLPGINIANVQDREYSLVGTLMYVEEDYLTAIRLVDEGKINLKALISAEYDIEDMAEAYKYIEDNKATAQKVICNI